MPALLIMAAGVGSRYGGLKQIDPVGPNGETIIDYSVYDAIRAGFSKLVFIIRPEMEKIFYEKIASKYEKSAEVILAFQSLDSCLDGFTPPAGREKPWGTGHAVLVTQSFVDEPFAAINGDDFYGPSSFEKMAEYLSAPREGNLEQYAMVGFVLRNTLSEHGYVSRGVCAHDSNLHLDKIVEKCKVFKDGPGAYYEDDAQQNHPLTGDEIVSMNLWGFQPTFYHHLKEQFKTFLEQQGDQKKSEFFIPYVVDTMIKDKQAVVKILPTDEQWFGVTYKEDKKQAVDQIQGLIKKGVYPERLW